MHIVKRKYIIKFFSLIFILFAVTVGIFIQNHNREKEEEHQEYLQSKLFFNNLFAFSQSLEQSFEKLSLTDDKTALSKEIYAKTRLMKNSIFNSGYPLSNALDRLSALEEYASGDMSDDSKNALWLDFLKSVNNAMLNHCSVYIFPDSLNETDKLFSVTEKPASDSVLKANGDYSILQNSLTAERKEVYDFARDILNYPLTPAVFKGYLLQNDALSFMGLNSYASIFPQGNTLSRMATTVNNTQSKVFSQADQAAEHYFSVYASYAQDCEAVFVTETTDTVYYIYCPVIELRGVRVYNYNEPIKLAVGKEDFSLKAFDGTAYLKNHQKTNFDISIPTVSLTCDCERFILLGDRVLKEGVITPVDGSKFYVLTSDEGSQQIFNQDEYLRYIDLG